MQNMEITVFDLTTIILYLEARTYFQRGLDHSSVIYKLKKNVKGSGHGLI
jgi:hypothetical protein